MILKETILSAFTERGTLLKWLKKVESALNNAVLSDVSVEQVSATQVKLRFTFENGDYIESPVLTLPRGDAGVGFNDAKEISINDGAVNITADDNGANIEASFEVAVGDEILAIPSTMYLPLKGSESIVIDVDESGDFIEVHLDTSIASKIKRSLVTPMSAPSSINIVGVDASNAQTMIKIGNGLIVEDGVLKLTQMNTIKAGTYRIKEDASPIIKIFDKNNQTELENVFNRFSFPIANTSYTVEDMTVNVSSITPLIAYEYIPQYTKYEITQLQKVFVDVMGEVIISSDTEITEFSISVDTEVTTAVAEWFGDNTVKLT